MTNNNGANEKPPLDTGVKKAEIKESIEQKDKIEIKGAKKSNGSQSSKKSKTGKTGKSGKNDRDRWLKGVLDSFPEKEIAFKPLLMDCQAVPGKDYVTVMQSKETNAFFGARITKDEVAHINAYGTATVIAPGNVRIVVNNFDDLLDGVRGTAKLLFIYMIMYISYNSKAGCEVMTSLRDYMAARGLRDPKSARIQIKEDMYALANTWIEFDRSKRKNEGDYIAVPIGQKHGIENGIVYFEFSPEFKSLLEAAQVMPLPREVLMFNQKYNPNSAFFLYKIAALQNMRMRKGTPKENIQVVSVRTLVENAPDLRSYEDVMATSKAVSRYILEPFKRDMDAIKSFRWEFCKNGAGDPDDEPNTYAEFINKFIRVEWFDYPMLGVSPAYRMLGTKSTKATKKK